MCVSAAKPARAADFPCVAGDDRFGVEGESYLRADYGVSCESEEYETIEELLNAKEADLMETLKDCGVKNKSAFALRDYLDTLRGSEGGAAGGRVDGG